VNGQPSAVCRDGDDDDDEEIFDAPEGDDFYDDAFGVIE